MTRRAVAKKVKVKPVTKASVMRVLRLPPQACSRAQAWFRKQSSLRRAYALVTKRRPSDGCSLGVTNYGCWLLHELGLHDKRVPTFKQALARARRSGWNNDRH